MKLNASNTSIIKRLLVGRSNRPLRSLLSKIEPADLASLFNSLNQRERRLFFDALMSIDKAQSTLTELPEGQVGPVLASLEDEQIVRLLVYASEADAAYFLIQMSEGRQEDFLSQLETPKQQLVRQFLNYPEDSAGRLMQTEVFCLSSQITASEGLLELRNRAQRESIYYIYCVNEEEQLIGIISLRQLAIAPAGVTLREILKGEVVSVTPGTSKEEVAKLVAHYDFIAIPVVDSTNRLMGIITVDDVVDVIQAQATAEIYAQAGLQEDDRIFTPPLKSIKNRLPWMFLNLFLAAIASTVISAFEETLSQVIFLASLINIVGGMGGNTAIQTLTVVTRGMATGDFAFISHSKALLKETFVGLTIGTLTGLAAGLMVYFWKNNLMVAVVIFISMVLNSLVAATCGALIPMGLKRLNWDPAAGSGVLVTMITDIFSFFSFLGIATLGLRYFA